MAPGARAPRGPVAPMGPSTEVGAGMAPMVDTPEFAAAQARKEAGAKLRETQRQQQAAAADELADAAILGDPPVRTAEGLLDRSDEVAAAETEAAGIPAANPVGSPTGEQVVNSAVVSNEPGHEERQVEGPDQPSDGANLETDKPVPSATPDHQELTPEVHPAPADQHDLTNADAVGMPPERGKEPASVTKNGENTQGAAPPPIDAQIASGEQAKAHNKAVGEHIREDKGLQEALGSDYDRLMADMFGTQDHPTDLDLQAAVDRLKGSSGSSEQRLLQRLREADAITGMEEGQATLDSLKSRTDKDSPSYEQAEKDARKQISEGKRALRNIDARDQIVADERVRQLLEDRGIDVQALNTEDAISMLKTRITAAGEHADSMDIRALNRLYEAQGIASLHEGQQELQRLREGEKAAVGDKQGEERDKAIEQYRKGTQGEYEEAKKTVEEGRPYQTQRELREKLRERLSKDPKLRRQLEEFAGEKVDVEDLDVAKFIKHLESLDSRTWGNDASMKGRAQELHDSLAHMRDDVRKDYFTEDMLAARTPEEQKAAFEGLAEASKYEPGRIKRFRDLLGQKMYGFSGEQMKYLGRQSKNYREGIKHLKKELENPKLSTEDRATLEGNLKNLKDLHGKVRKEIIGKNILKALLFLILFNTLALTLGPTLLAAKMFQLAGKAQQ